MWNQHQTHHAHQLHASLDTNHQSLLLAPRPEMAAAVSAAGIILPVSGGTAMGGSSSSAAARPASMAERSRMAKIPQPEPGLKCPRCDSTNTKFCYFNNYSLTQPRHFCKSCRRYWTRGGALRNVPVGGGCRRNKRSTNKPSSSKKPSSSAAATGGGVMAPPPQMELPPFGSSLHHLACDGASRLGFPELGSMHAVDHYHLGGGVGLERQQFPFLTRPNTAGVQVQPPLMSPGISSYPFGGDVEVGVGDMPAAGSAGLITQMSSVKMDDMDNPPPSVAAPTSSPREFLGLRGSLQQFWGNGGGGGGHRGGGDGDGAGGSVAPGGAAWSELPAFDLSTSGNIL